MRSPPLRLARPALLIAPVVAFIASQLWPLTARPLPLFSRELQVSCGACHAPTPALNAAGRGFMQSGYRTLDGSEPPERTREIPLAVVANLGVESTRHEVAHPAWSRTMLGERAEPAAALELHSAGTLARDVTYHLQLDRNEDHPAFETRSAFVQLNDLARTDVNLKAGISQSELVFLSNERRLTLQPYLSPVTLDARGFELNDAAGPLDLTGGMTTSDRDRLEDSYWSFLANVRGSLIAGRMLFDRQNSNLSFHTWLQHLRAVTGGAITAGRTVATLGYVFDRFDDRPAAGIHQRRQYYLLDLYRPLDAGERWWVTARYEHEYQTETVLTREEDHQLGVLNLKREVNANAKLGLEATHSGDNVAGPRTNTLSAYVDLAF